VLNNLKNLFIKPSKKWKLINPKFLPFADVASEKLPLIKLLQLSLFQVSVGVGIVLLVGTLNRVMIVELGVSSTIVALMVALPLFFAPFRAFVGFRSDTHKSAIGWKRIPYIWVGSLLQFGGLSIMPFALILLSGDTHWPYWFAFVASAISFLLVGAGTQIVQTTGLALATDIAPETVRPRVVALMYTMLLVGMVVSSIFMSFLLEPFSQVRLIQVIQGIAVFLFFHQFNCIMETRSKKPNSNKKSKR
jgi:BCD family chlorophyll transporter-like MFS transporter